VGLSTLNQSQRVPFNLSADQRLTLSLGAVSKGAIKQLSTGSRIEILTKHSVRRSLADTKNLSITSLPAHLEEV